MGFAREECRVEVDEAGGGYSGARWVADERRFLTLVRRLLDSDVVVGVELVSCESVDLLENRLDSLLLDFFLSPNMIAIVYARTELLLHRHATWEVDSRAFTQREAETNSVPCKRWLRRQILDQNVGGRGLA